MFLVNWLAFRGGVGVSFDVYLAEGDRLWEFSNGRSADLSNWLILIS